MTSRDKPTPAALEEEMLLLTYTMRDALMKRYEYSELLATEVAGVIVDALRSERGGERLYIHAPDNRARDERIRSDLRTGNAAEIAKRENLSERRVYQIARRR